MLSRLSVVCRCVHVYMRARVDVHAYVCRCVRVHMCTMRTCARAYPTTVRIYTCSSAHVKMCIRARHPPLLRTGRLLGGEPASTPTIHGPLSGWQRGGNGGRLHVPTGPGIEAVGGDFLTCLSFAATACTSLAACAFAAAASCCRLLFGTGSGCGLPGAPGTIPQVCAPAAPGGRGGVKPVASTWPPRGVSRLWPCAPCGQHMAAGWRASL